MYSYGRHFVLGEFIKNKKGGTAVMLNDSRYSNTTSKHQSAARSAVNHYRRFYTSAAESDNVLTFIEEMMGKMAKARKPEMYASQANQRFKAHVEYLEWKGLPYKSKPEFKAIKKAIDALNEGVTDKYFSVKEKDRKKAQKKAREAAEKYLAEEKIRNAGRAAKELEDYNEWLAQFFAHEPYKNRRPTFNYVSHDDIREHLRVTPDGKHVETTLGLRVSAVECAMLYQKIKAGEDVIGYKIDNYTVLSKNGVLKIGCHIFDMQHVTDIGELLLSNEAIKRLLSSQKA